MSSHRYGVVNCESLRIILCKKVVPDLGKPIINNGFLILIEWKLNKILSNNKHI